MLLGAMKSILKELSQCYCLSRVSTLLWTWKW